MDDKPGPSTQPVPNQDGASAKLIRQGQRTRLAQLDDLDLDRCSDYALKHYCRELHSILDYWADSRVSNPDGEKHYEAIESGINLIDRFEREMETRGAVQDAKLRAKRAAERVIQQQETAIASVKTAREEQLLLAAKASKNIEPPKFTGRKKDWRAFWAGLAYWFSLRPHVNNLDKLYVLRNALDSSALELIAACYEGDDAFDNAVAILKKRFDCSEEARSELVAELDCLRKPASGEDLAGMEAMLSTFNRVKAGLTAWEADETYFRWAVTPRLMDLLPKDLREMVRLSDADTLDERLAVLEKRRKIVALEQASAVARRAPGKDAIAADKKKGTVATVIAESAASVQPAETVQLVQTVNPAPVSQQTNKFSKWSCLFCGDAHGSNSCPSYSSYDQRLTRVVELKLCTKCLRRDHATSECTKKTRCYDCDGPHVRYLCKQSLDSGSRKGQAITTVAAAQKKPTAYLKTLRARVRGRRGSRIVRVLVDEGSHFSFTTRSLLDELGLETSAAPELLVAGVDGNESSLKRVAELQLFSLDGLDSHAISCYILPSIARPFDNALDADVLKMAEQRGFVLDEEAGDEQPIDVLIGSKQAIRIWKQPPTLLTDGLAIYDTKFGCCLCGDGDTQSTDKQAVRAIATVALAAPKDTYQTGDAQVQLLMDLRRMWAFDGIDDPNQPDPEAALDDFKQNLVLQDGRYRVRMPWVLNPLTLASNRNQAYRRLLQQTSRVKKHGRFEEYDRAICEYVRAGHAELAPPASGDCYYLPHQPVYRDDKETTKLRVVFDASSRAAGERSLNDCLSIGTELNPLIIQQLIRFRFGAVAVCADIEKAFLQIVIDERDRDYLRYFWYVDGRPTEFRLTALPFGMISSPFYLAATLRQHLRDHAETHPKAAAVSDRFYVDDLVVSVTGVTEAEQLKAEVCDVLAKCSMSIRKWRCSSHDLDRLWAGESAPAQSNVLGLTWNCVEDRLSLKPRAAPVEIWTKRALTSACAKNFDPLGLAAPAVIKTKLIIQKLHRLKYGWDVEITLELHEEAAEALADLDGIEIIEVNRKIADDQAGGFMLVCCDASSIAYGAAVYWCFDGKQTLMFARTKNAPMKELTIVQLELQAAVFAVNIAKKLKKMCKPTAVRYLTDSMVTLDRLHGAVNRQETFVRNRILHILSEAKPAQWSHVRTECNPADLVSRGCSAKELATNSLWWNGPPSAGVRTRDQMHAVREGASAEPQVAAPDMAVALAVLVNEESSWLQVKRYETIWRIVCWAAKRMAVFREGELENRRKVLLLRALQSNAFGRQIALLRQGRPARYEGIWLQLDGDGLARAVTRYQTNKPAIDKPYLLEACDQPTRLWLRRLHVRWGHLVQPRC